MPEELQEENVSTDGKMTPKVFHARAVAFQDSPLVLGEGPFWHTEEQKLYLVDIKRGRSCWFDPQTLQTGFAQFTAPLGFAVPASDGGLIGGSGHMLCRLDIENEKQIFLSQAANDIFGLRFNDGKCDSRGRLWAGTMPLDESAAIDASFYKYDESGLQVVREGMKASNGIAFSSDNRAMFHVDTGDKTIWKYDFDCEKGIISSPVVWLRLNDTLPDGICTDRDGNIYVACWGAGRIEVYDAKAEKIADILLPVTQVSSCCFGDADLKTLYITTARDGLSADQFRVEPLAGALFSVHLDHAQGQPSHSFTGWLEGG